MVRKEKALMRYHAIRNIFIRHLYFMNASLDIYFSARKCRIVNTMVGLSALHYDELPGASTIMQTYMQLDNYSFSTNSKIGHTCVKAY